MGDVAHDVHPGSPPEHDDANPHARHALCQMLDRLGADGCVAWINSVGVRQLQEDLYEHARWSEEHATAPLRERAEKAERERNAATTALAAVQVAARALRASGRFPVMYSDPLMADLMRAVVDVARLP